MQSTRWIAPLVGALIAGGISWLVIAISFDPFTVVGGSQPASIWGPTLGLGSTATATTLLIMFAAASRGRARIVCGILWAVFLASATHRLVERSDGSVADSWFGMTVQQLAADPAEEPEAKRCSVGRWIARCSDGKATLVSPSLLPMAPLLPGRWEG